MIRRSRRRVLATAGTATLVALTGCGSLLEDEEPEPRFSPDRLRTVLAEPVEDVRRPAPVHPTVATVEGSLERADVLIDRVPDPIAPSMVPNGVVRVRIERTMNRAVEEREAAGSDPDPFHALRRTRIARQFAEEAAIAFDAVGNDQVLGELDDRLDDARTIVDARVGAHEYRGDDPFRTLLLVYRLEADMAAARARLPAHGPDDASVLDLGELGGDIEYAMATVDLRDHLVERHTERIGDSIDFRSTYADALASVRSSVRDSDLPTGDSNVDDVVDGEIDRRDVRYLLGDALRGVTHHAIGLGNDLDSGRLGRGLYRAFRFERDRRAFDAIVDRVDDGRFPAVESVDRIREEREAVLRAFDDVPVKSSEPTVAGDALAELLIQMRRIDDGVRGYVEYGNDATVEREYARYAHLRARAEAMPGAIESFRARLDVS